MVRGKLNIFSNWETDDGDDDDDNDNDNDDDDGDYCINNLPCTCHQDKYPCYLVINPVGILFRP